LTNNDLDFLKEWFGRFRRSYYREDEKEQLNILLKEEHSLLVAQNALAISTGEVFEPGDILIAEAVGLLHDVGRFPQYAQYRTFVDRISVNHGQLGAETLAAEGALSRLPVREQELIVQAVQYHNAFAVPEDMDLDAALFTRVARDADKIDIWRVFCDHFEKPPEERAEAATLGLPDGPVCSSGAIAALAGQRIVRLADVKTVNDYKLLMLSWVYDLNFMTSFRLVAERGVIDRITAQLPQSADISAAVSVAQAYIRSRLEKGA
jgi:HD superfamily phosphohydrolase YqeK